MAARGVDVSYETIRCWTIKFGPLIARRLRKRRWPPTPRWHLDEMVCGQRHAPDHRDALRPALSPTWSRTRRRADLLAEAGEEVLTLVSAVRVYCRRVVATPAADGACDGE